MPPSQKQYPNAQWAAWIQEVADEAASKNTKAFETYRKAAQSIKNHPVKLNHPKDALPLIGVGPKVVGIIKSRLEEWCRSQNVSFPAQVPLSKSFGAPVSKATISSSRLKPCQSNKPRSAITSKHSQTEDTTGCAPVATAGISEISSDDDLDSNRPRPATSIKKKRTYFPKRRDAAWGILAAMYSFCEITDQKKFSSKDTIIQGAQKYCDLSYSTPNGNGNNSYKTVWNSGIERLMRHELVLLHPTIRPAKYSLTRPGFELARQIASSEKIPILELDCTSQKQSSSSLKQANSRIATTFKGSGTSKVLNSHNDLPSNAASTTESGTSSAKLPFQFFYIDLAGRRVRELSRAVIRNAIDEENQCKIEFLASQKLHPFCSKNIVIDQSDSDSNISLLPLEKQILRGWLKFSKSIPTCPGFFPESEVISSGQQPLKQSVLEVQAPFKSHHAKPHKQMHNPSTRPVSVASFSLPSHNRFKRLDDLERVSRSGASFATPDTSPSNFPRPHMSETELADIALALKTEIWKGGTYSIALVIDNREVKSKSDRDGFYDLCASKLRKNLKDQVQVQQRALVVGDALWIAIENSTGQEVVLDSVVERKRLDDLCASIKDARFHEQKARLKKSGLRDRIYLIESQDTQANREKFGQQVRTSKAELMLLDDCHLQLTAHWKDSVEYLAMRTEVLHELHQSIDLSVIPDAHIDRSSYLPLLAELRRSRQDDYWVTSYSVFESLNNKTSNMKVKDVWARMIHHVNGMSVEKVAEFVVRWPTPRIFWEELHHHVKYPSTSLANVPTDKWIEEQFSHQDVGTRKKLGPVLSKRIADLYTLRHYHTSKT